MANKNKFFVLKLIIFIISMSFILSGDPNIYAANSMNGAGTKENPYQITTLEQLNEVRNDLSAHYILMNDIDASDTVNWNDGKGWNPIGNSSTKFNGYFNGNGHIINNLYINRPLENYIGLFGCSETNWSTKGYIENIGLENVNIVGGNIVGGIKGYGGDVYNCYVSGTISGNDKVGGIYGDLFYNDIVNCYSKATIIGNTNVGGIVGNGSTYHINNCYSPSKIIGNKKVGPISGNISLAYPLQNCYYDEETTGISRKEDMAEIALSTSDSKIGANYKGFDFFNIWSINPSINDGYPYLRIFGDYSDDITGSGTQEDPYIIWSVEGLNQMRFGLYAYYKLGKDIDASEIYDISKEGFLPIGVDSKNDTNSFKGQLDGNGFKIINLYINKPIRNYVGLFAKLDNAIIKNIIISVDIIGNWYVGGLSGYSNNNSTIENVHVSGRIESMYSYIGGIIGYTNNTALKKCSSKASIYAYKNYAGGLVGNSYDSNIEDSYFTGCVISQGNYCGGITGYQTYNTIIKKCYSTANVIGNNYIGGLIGVRNSGSTIDSYWDIEKSGVINSAGGTGLTTEQMKQQSSYNNWEFGNIWELNTNANDGYPSLKCKSYEVSDITKPIITVIGKDEIFHRVGGIYNDQGAIACDDTDGDITDNIIVTNNIDINIPGDYWVKYNVKDSSGNTAFEKIRLVRVITMDGKGTKEEPFIITNLDELNQIRKYLSCYFELGNDIDASETKTWNEGKGWKPIGNSTSNFKGFFNGNGYTIRNLYINRPSESYIGLFGYTYDGVIENTILESVNITGSYVVGGLIGYACNSSKMIVKNIKVIGVLNCNSYYLGGVIGVISRGTVEQTYFDGILNSTSSYVGGIVGGNSSTELVIRNSYSSGTISGESYIGGIIGQTFGSIINCYSTAVVSYGIVHYNNGRVSDCYWDVESSGTNKSTGGTGFTTEQMKKQSSYTNWDFDNIWRIHPSFNNGYPYLIIFGPDIVTSNSIPIVLDISDNNNASDIQVTFNGASNETNISEYRIFVVKSEQADDFNILTAKGLEDTKYVCVPKNGDNFEYIVFLAGNLQASDGTQIENNQDYKVFIMTVGANGYLDRLSMPSDVFTLTTLDVILPVIKLSGDNPQTIEVKSPYIKLDATATDDFDGDISGSIIIDSSGVNTSKVGTYIVKYNVTDSSRNKAEEVIRTVNVVDNTSPIITLIGESNITLNLGQKYTEQGATGEDNYDGDLTSSVVITGSVDTNRVGEYILKYNVTDSIGNIAQEVIRTVKVVDTKAPIITLKGDSKITINIGQKYIEQGATATDNYDGDISKNIIISGSVDINTVGYYILKYNVSDSSGNKAIETTRTIYVVRPPSNPVQQPQVPEKDNNTQILNRVAQDIINIVEKEPINTYAVAVNTRELANKIASQVTTIETITNAENNTKTTTVVQIKEKELSQIIENAEKLSSILEEKLEPSNIKRVLKEDMLKVNIKTDTECDNLNIKLPVNVLVNSNKKVNLQINNVTIPSSALKTSQIQETINKNQKAYLQFEMKNLDDISGLDYYLAYIGDKLALKESKIIKTVELNFSIVDDDGNKIAIKELNDRIDLEIDIPDNLGKEDKEKLVVFDSNKNFIGGSYNAKTEKVHFKISQSGRYKVVKEEKTFEDIKDNAYKTYIEILASKHLTEGISDEEYGPEMLVTRAQAATFVQRI